MIRRLLFLAVLCCFPAIPVQAANAGIEVGGRVLLPGGEPLAGAQVRLLELADPITEARDAHEAHSPEAAVEARSDAKGRFRITAPRAGMWRLRIDADGFVPLEAQLRPLLEPAELPDAELTTDAGLTVRVADPAGKPVAGASVHLDGKRPRFFSRSSPWSFPAMRGKTESDGKLRLPRSESGASSVSLAAPGFAHVARPDQYGNTIRIKLSEGASKSLEVRNSRGKPVEGVMVAVGESPVVVGFTDTDGKLASRLDPSVIAVLHLLAPDGRRLQTRLRSEEIEREGPQRLELPDRQWVQGRVIDAESRRPVTDGLVWDALRPFEMSTTDGAGGFSLGGTAGERVSIVAGAPGYLRGFGQEHQLGRGGKGPTLVLRPGAAIEGIVVDGDEDPVAGAEIEVEAKQRPGRYSFSSGRSAMRPRAVSTSRGSFRLGPLDPERSYVVKVRAEGFAPAEQSVSGLEPHRTRGGLQLTLTRGQGVTGKVVDSEGRAISEAVVTLDPTPDEAGSFSRMMRSGDGMPAFEAVGNADGLFEISGLPAGRFDLEVSRTGFARGKKPGIEIREEAEPVDLGEIVLEPGETFQGMAVDGDGQAIEGVDVRLSEDRSAMAMMGMPGGEEEPDAVTDAGGWFALNDLARNLKYELNLFRSGYVTAAVSPVEVPQGEPLRVVMQAASDVSGTVVDSQGEPIAGARVTMTRARTMRMGDNTLMTMTSSSEATDAAGRFLFEDQEPGKISLEAVASGWQEAELKDIEVPEGEDLEGLELPLKAGAIIEGRVLAPDGRAAIGAWVKKVTGGTGPDFSGRSHVDGEGRFRLEGLAPGKVSIEAEHKDYPRLVKDLETSEGTNSVELQFTGGHEVSGRVLDDAGNPIAGADVRLTPAGRYWGGPETSTDADGNFNMPGAQDGTYSLWAQAEGFAPHSGEMQVKVEGAPVQGLEVRLSAGGAVSGKVTGVDPELYSKASVRAEGSSWYGRHTVNVDHQGEYRIENLAPGSYNIVGTLADSGRRATGRVELEEGDMEVRLDLEFSGGLTLSGRAVQGETPVAGAMVNLDGVDIDHRGWTQTDLEGAFSIDGLEPGSYRVNLQNWKTGLSHTETLDLATSREVVLRVPTARIAGRVADAADGRPLAGVHVRLDPREADEADALADRQATSDVEGRFALNNVPDGEWRLSASKKGYTALNRSVTVQFERDVADLRLSMDATEGLTLEVRQSTGAVPEEVRIAVLDGSGSRLLGGHYGTGENGRVHLSSVPPGSWELLVSAGGSAVRTLRADAPGATVPVLLEPACVLRVSVPELRESISLATVGIRSADGIVFRTIGWNGAPDGEFKMRNGEIRFMSLPRGSWTVEVTAGDGRSWQEVVTTSPDAPAELTLD